MKLKAAQALDRWRSTHKGWAVDDNTGLLVPKDLKVDEIERRRTGVALIAEVKDGQGAAVAPGAKAFDPQEKMVIAGIANAKMTDRMNEVLNPVGIDVQAYLKNNVLLAQHCHADPIGLVTVLRPEDNGVHFEAWIGDPKAAPLTKKQEEYRSLVAQRVLKAVSVGFIPTKIRMPAYNEDGIMVEPAVIEAWEMLELSIVSVPCNPGALFEAKAASGTKQRRVWNFPKLGADGKFIVKSEAKRMDEELKELMQQQLTALNSIASGMNSLKAGIDTLQKSMDTIQAPGKSAKAAEGDDEEEENNDDDKKKKGKKKPDDDNDAGSEPDGDADDEEEDKKKAALEAEVTTLRASVEGLKADVAFLVTKLADVERKAVA